MSQAGRMAHSIHKAQHAQREFGYVQPKLEPVGTDTTWIPEFLSSAKGIGQFNINSIIALQLGSTTDERMVKLRKASSMGVLRMSAYRVKGQFVEYRWEAR